MKHRVVPFGVFSTATADRELRTEIGNPWVKNVSERVGGRCVSPNTWCQMCLCAEINEHQHVCGKILPSLLTGAGGVEGREDGFEQMWYFGKRSQR